MDIAKTIGIKIKNGRNALGLSMSQFAARIGRHPAELSKMESGDMDLRLSEIDQIFEAAEIKFDELAGEVKNSEQAPPQKDLRPTLRDVLSIIESVEHQIAEMRSKITMDMDYDSFDSQRNEPLPVRSISDSRGPAHFGAGNLTPI